MISWVTLALASYIGILFGPPVTSYNRVIPERALDTALNGQVGQSCEKTMPFAASPSHHHLYGWYKPSKMGWVMTVFYPHKMSNTTPKSMISMLLPAALDH